MATDTNIMTDANRSALNFHISSVERVRQLCDPLKYLGITGFGYMKIFNDSRYLHICTYDRWARYFIQNVHDTGQVFSKIMSLVHSETISFVWPDEATDDLLLALKSHHIFYGITFYRRTGSFIEHWSFCAPSENEGVQKLYLKHSGLLWEFAQYFCEYAPDLTDHSDPCKLGMYKNGHGIAAPTNVLEEEKIGKFLQGIETKQYLLKCNHNWAFVSEKEKQFLELASRGLEPSNHMELSLQIVSKRLEEIKFRLGATSMDELLEAFRSSQLQRNIQMDNLDHNPAAIEKMALGL